MRFTGHVRKGSDIDIHVFSDDVSAITEILDACSYCYEVERKRVIKHNVERIFTHVHLHDDYTYELTMYGRDQVNYTFKSSVTGKAIDPHDHVAAGLEALAGTLTEREEFLVAHHMDAREYRDGKLGVKLRRRLETSEWFDDLMALRDIDDRARVPGTNVCAINEAIALLMAMAEEDT